MNKERFKKPTEEEIIGLAIKTADTIDSKRIADLSTFATILIERLYDNGDINIPSEKERRFYAGESIEEIFPDDNSK